MLTSSRATNVLLVLILAVGGGIVAMLAQGVRGGSLDPPGPPAPTQSNVIYQPASCAGFPIVLSAPGSYRLGGNITGCAGEDGIQITASSVVLDLGGFTLFGVPDSLNGITSVGAINSLSVSNGIIAAWGGTGLYLGGSELARVDNIIATYNQGDGIELGSSSSVSHTTSSRNGGVGFALMVAAINSTISDCHADFNSTGIAATPAEGLTVRNCSIGNNTSSGIEAGAFATIANNHVHHNANGVLAEQSCMVADNAIESNGGHGLYVSAPGSNCTVVRNKATANGQNGITLALDNRSWVDSNHAAGNGEWGFFIGAGTVGNPNIVTRNAASGNAFGNYSIGINNDAGPITTAAAATNPLSNISN